MYVLRICIYFYQEKLDAQQPQQPQGAMIYAVVDKTKKQQDVSRSFIVILS